MNPPLIKRALESSAGQIRRFHNTHNNGRDQNAPASAVLRAIPPVGAQKADKRVRPSFYSPVSVSNFLEDTDHAYMKEA